MRCIIETQSWIRPQNDPYRLENFQQAYDNIVSGESKIVRASDEFAASARSVRKEFFVIFFLGYISLLFHIEKDLTLTVFVSVSVPYRIRCDLYL